MSGAEFALEGRRFEVPKLSPDDSCLAVEILGKVLGPAWLEVFAARNEGEATRINYAVILQALLANASKLSVLLKLFTARAKFDRGNNGILIDLKPFTDEVFSGRVDLIVAFLFHAARAEYGYFLSGGGALASLVDLLGTASGSPPAPTG